jgi:hypothetical protein
MSQTKPVVSEFSIIPRWARLLAALAFAGSMAGWAAFIWNVPMREPETWFMPFTLLAAALFGGSLVAAVVLLTGYVNRDSRRRGMSARLWTILVLVIPNGIGFIVYFLVRLPLRVPCPGCGQPIAAGSVYCPMCGAKVAKTCPGCDRPVTEGDAHCPHCGQALGV